MHLLAILALLAASPSVARAAAPSNAPAAAAATSAAPTAVPQDEITILVVRHAEAASEPQPDPGLSEAGRARVKCLAGILKDERLTHVVTSPYRRARETAEGLAGGLQVEPKDPTDARALAASLSALPAGSRALVVGHSNTIPALVQALGGGLEGLVEERGMPALPRDQFDRLVRVRLRAGSPEKQASLSDLRDERQSCPAPASPR